MKKVILTTTLIVVASNAYAGNTFTRWFTHDIPAAAKLATEKSTYWMKPHKGDKSFKARYRHCKDIGGEYDDITQECGIPDKICKGGVKTYTALARLPKTKSGINCNLVGI